MTNATNVDWIQDGPRHSFGTYLKYEMGTGVASLDKNYLVAKVKAKKVNRYFSVSIAA